MTATTIPIKARCPICEKNVSYKGGILNRHGYKVEFHQHTLNQCWGSYKATDGLLSEYLKQLKGWMDSSQKDFPSEWAGSPVLGCVDLRSPEYKAYREWLAMKQLHQTLSRKLAVSA
jgi:hypothetical protein